MSGHPPACIGCRTPITSGQARWTQREPDEFWHWTCAEAAGLTVGPLYRRFMAPLPRQTRVHDQSRPQRPLTARTGS